MDIINAALFAHAGTLVVIDDCPQQLNCSSESYACSDANCVCDAVGLMASVGMLRMVPAPLHSGTDQCFCEVVELNPSHGLPSAPYEAPRGQIHRHTLKWLQRLGLMDSINTSTNNTTGLAIQPTMPVRSASPPEFERGGVHHGRAWSAMWRRPAAAADEGRRG